MILIHAPHYERRLPVLLPADALVSDILATVSNKIAVEAPESFAVSNRYDTRTMAFRPTVNSTIIGRRC